MQEQSKEDDRNTKSSKYNSFKHLNGMTHSHSSDALPGKLLINLLHYRGRLDGGTQPTSQLLSSHYTIIR